MIIKLLVLNLNWLIGKIGSNACGKIEKPETYQYMFKYNDFIKSKS